MMYCTHTMVMYRWQNKLYLTMCTTATWSFLYNKSLRISIAINSTERCIYTPWIEQLIDLDTTPESKLKESPLSNFKSTFKSRIFFLSLWASLSDELSSMQPRANFFARLFTSWVSSLTPWSIGPLSDLFAEVGKGFWHMSAVSDSRSHHRHADCVREVLLDSIQSPSHVFFPLLQSFVILDCSRHIWQ